MKTTMLPATVIALALTGASPSFAQDPFGTWLTPEGKATVKVADCGGALCATILSLKQPNDPTTGRPQLDRGNSDVSKRNRPVVGVQLLMGMKPQGPNKWVGQAYNPEDGNIYPATATLVNANTLNVQGCILGGMICRTFAWTRKPDAAARAQAQ